MECKATSGKRYRSSAMTLVEMMVASGVGGLVFIAIANLTVFTSRTFNSVLNYTDMDQKSRYALDLMTSEIRQADRVASMSGTNVNLVVAGVTNLSYNYSSGTRKLTRTKSGVTTDLLTECDSMTFTGFAAGTLTNTFDQFTATNAAQTKLLKMNWTCSRTHLGAKVNTESVQSAKIVIRKQ